MRPFRRCHVSVQWPYVFYAIGKCEILQLIDETKTKNISHSCQPFVTEALQRGTWLRRLRKWVRENKTPSFWQYRRKWPHLCKQYNVNNWGVFSEYWFAQLWTFPSDQSEIDIAVAIGNMSASATGQSNNVLFLARFMTRDECLSAIRNPNDDRGRTRMWHYDVTKPFNDLSKWLTHRLTVRTTTRRLIQSSWVYVEACLLLYGNNDLCGSARPTGISQHSVA